MLPWLNRNGEIVSAVGVPVLVVLFDVLVRSGFGLSVEDVGPDLALIATTGFFGIAASRPSQSARSNQASAVALTLGSTAAWVFSLLVLSRWGTISLAVGVPMLALYGWILFEAGQLDQEEGRLWK